MQFKLDHTILRKIGQHLGYPLRDEGLCYGFSCMLMQAILAEEESQFWERLHLIARYQPNFSVLATQIEAVKCKVKKRSLPLTKQDNQLLEILAFYEGIELYLNVQLHHDAFNKFTLQENVDEIYHLTKSTKLKNSSLSIVLNQSSAHGNIESLMDYLNALEKVIQQHTNLPILITSSNHSVLVTYNSATPQKPWMYVDTNDFARYSSNPNYYRELNTSELAKALFDSLSPYPNPVLFNIKLVANTGHPINNEQSLQHFQAIYKIENKHTKMYDQFGAGLLFIACQNGRTEIVHILLEQDGIEINKAMLDGCTPLYIACQNGLTEIVHKLLKRNDVEINKTLQNGCSPLYIACQKGNISCATLLLQTNKATIDSIGLLQHTPLLVACLSPHTQEKNELFRLLLKYEANPFHKNDKGQTAYDIAFAQSNHAAITELLLHARNYHLPLNHETKSKARNWINSLSKSPDNRFFNSSLLPPGLERYIYDSTNPSDSNNLENKK